MNIYKFTFVGINWRWKRRGWEHIDCRSSIYITIAIATAFYRIDHVSLKLDGHGPFLNAGINCFLANYCSACAR